VANKGALNLMSPHGKLLRSEMSSAKVTSFFTASGSKSNDTVLVAEGAFAVYTMKHCSTMKCSWADRHLKKVKVFQSLRDLLCPCLKGEYGDGVRDGDGFSP
jgi:hypothetical protein